MVRKQCKSDGAVSPVVGVMLMLVVVVIIAGVVTMFSTGLLSETSAAPNVQLAYVGIIPGTFEEENSVMGLVFQHEGGDEINIRTLTLQLKSTSNNEEVTIDFADDIYDQGTSPSDKESFGTPDAERMYILGNPSDTLKYVLRTGDRLCIVPEVYAKENNVKKVTYIADRGGSSPNYYSNGTLTVSPVTEYKLIDQKSGAVIASGRLTGSEL